MASNVQVGKGILTGITNSGSAITMTGVATFTLDTAKAVHKFEVERVKDENNFTCAKIATDMRVELDVTWTPSAATRAAAAATAVFPVALTSITLANFSASEFNGTWGYNGDASIDLSHGPAKMSLKLERFQDSSQNTSLTTTVSG